MSSLPVTALPAVTAFSRLSPHARAREGVIGEKPVTRGNAVTPPSKVTILRHCRCKDCRKFWQSAGTYYCDAGIGGTAIVWATGERICEPAPDQWHYCAGYEGPRISKEIWVWKYPQGGESHARH